MFGSTIPRFPFLNQGRTAEIPIDIGLHGIDQFYLMNKIDPVTGGGLFDHHQLESALPSRFHHNFWLNPQNPSSSQLPPVGA